MKKPPKKKSQTTMLGAQGFTLVEMAIVLVIFGILITIGMIGLRHYIGNKAYENTITALDMNNSGLLVFQGTYRRYPCPANPALPESDPQYGYEDCSLPAVIGRDADNADGDNDPSTGGDTVLIGAFPFKTLLDPDGDGDMSDAVLNAAAAAEEEAKYSAPAENESTETTENTGSNAEGAGSDDIGVEPCDPNERGCGVTVSRPPVIGIVNEPTNPAQGGGYTARYATDGWSNRFTYAVTQSLTSADSFNQDNGAIDIQTEVRQSLLDIPGSAHFVLISHGENGKGAYSRNGSLVDTCAISVVNPGEPPPTISTLHEIENCNNNNAVFVDGLKNDTRERHYDDHIRYVSSVITSLWGYSTPTLHDNDTPTNPNDDYWINRISNLNGGNVGIGTNDPQERLHVIGDMQATRVNVDELCSKDGFGPCMPVAALADELASMQCPTGEIVTAIEENAVRCRNPFGSLPAQTCRPGLFAYGISSRTGLLCR